MTDLLYLKVILTILLVATLIMLYRKIKSLKKELYETDEEYIAKLIAQTIAMMLLEDLKKDSMGLTEEEKTTLREQTEKIK